MPEIFCFVANQGTLSVKICAVCIEPIVLMRVAVQEEEAKRVDMEKRVLAVVAAVGLGFYLGFRLPEEQRINLLRIVRELKELPFRLYL